MACILRNSLQLSSISATVPPYYCIQCLSHGKRKAVHVASLNNCPHCKELLPPDAHVCPHCDFQLHAETSEPHPVAQPHQEMRVQLPEDPNRSLPEIAKQFDSSATTHISLTGVLTGFYSGAIFAGKVFSGSILYSLVYALPLYFLLATIIFSLGVFYPEGYLTADYLALIQKKEQRMRVSSILLEVAVGILIIAIFVYLSRAIP